MQQTHMPALMLLASVLVSAPSISAAQGITGIVSDNRSTANSSVSFPHGASEFGSITSFQPAVLDNHVASFTHRMAWFGGLYTEPLPSLGFLSSSQVAELAYTVTFTVQDPHNQGFTLRMGSELRGVLRAMASSPANASAELDSFRLSVLPGNGPGPVAELPVLINLPDLTTPRARITATGFVPDNEFSVNQSGRSPVGHWRGTRSFTLIVDGGDSAWDNYALTTYPALSFMQFGLAPHASELVAGYYTGNGLPSINDLGHLLTVQAVYDIPPVHEPATALLWTCGMAALWLRRRKLVGPNPPAP